MMEDPIKLKKHSSFYYIIKVCENLEKLFYFVRKHKSLKLGHRKLDYISHQAINGKVGKYFSLNRHKTLAMFKGESS